MPSELETALQQHVTRQRNDDSVITADEVIDRAQSSKTAPSATRLTAWWARWPAAAAVLAFVAVAGVVVQSGDDSTTVITPSAPPSPANQTESSNGSPAANPPVLSEDPPSPDTTVVAPPRTTASSSTVAAIDVASAQRDALRVLPGFSATATITRTGAEIDETEPDNAIQYTLLADGSFYADLGADSFGSFDPATGRVVGAFRDEAGQLIYQEIVGQADSALPLNVLGGYDPTEIAALGSPDEPPTIREIQFEQRPAWEVTTIDTVGGNLSAAGIEADEAHTTVQVIDQASGLVVSTSITSTDPTVFTRDVVLTGLTVVDEMPDEFPGEFPAGAVVATSGNPSGAMPVDVDAVASHFGIATPVPEQTHESTTHGVIITTESNTHQEGDDPGLPGSVIYRDATFLLREGFLTTTVKISGEALREGRTPREGFAVVDGYLCNDGDANGECDSNPIGDQPVVISNGALAGASVFIDESLGVASATVIAETFQVFVYGTDRATAVDILNGFTIEVPA